MYSPPAVLQSLTIYLLSQTARAAKINLDDSLAARGVHMRHMAVLAALTDDPAGAAGPETTASSQLGVGQRLAIDPSDMTAVADDLERLGHVKRIVDPADRRRRILLITPAGTAFLGELLREAAVVADDLLSVLPPGRRAAFGADLAVLGAHAIRRRAQGRP